MLCTGLKGVEILYFIPSHSVLCALANHWIPQGMAFHYGSHRGQHLTMDSSGLLLTRWCALSFK